MEALEERVLNQTGEHVQDNGCTHSTNEQREGADFGISRLSSGTSPKDDQLPKGTKKRSKEKAQETPLNQDGNCDTTAEDLDNECLTGSHFAKKKKKMKKADFINTTRNKNIEGLNFYEQENSLDQEQEDNFAELMEENNTVDFLYITTLIRPMLKCNKAKFDKWVGLINFSKDFTQTIDKYLRIEVDKNMILKNAIFTVLNAFDNKKKGVLLKSDFEKLFYETLYEKVLDIKVHCLLPNQNMLDFYCPQHRQSWFLV